MLEIKWKSAGGETRINNKHNVGVRSEEICLITEMGIESVGEDEWVDIINFKIKGDEAGKKVENNGIGGWKLG